MDKESPSRLAKKERPLANGTALAEPKFFPL
jgi:hypothetical protein